MTSRSDHHALALPNPRGLWDWGISLSPYSHPYGQLGVELTHTPNGELINSYKYHSYLRPERRDGIVRTFTDQVFSAVYEEFHERFPLAEHLPFDICLGPPENRETGHSLPREVCRLLSEEREWIIDGFAGIRKTRQASTLKGIPQAERKNHLAGLYEVNKETMPYSNFGFLIIDDVFETGSTVSSLCETLEEEYPGLPRFVIALTHLRLAESSVT
jgi:hypothetical protein